MAFDLPVSAFVSIDSTDARRAGRERLSLALIDTRNQTLHLMSQYEEALADFDFEVPYMAELNPPLWEFGHIGWFQERWIGRNLQRHQGPHCDAQAPRLASIKPSADAWWDEAQAPHASRWELALPGVDNLKSYLLATLESTLDLLEKTPDEDAALYFYRLALFHEDMHGEALIHMAQTLGLPLGLALPVPLILREPLRVSAMRWQLGLDVGQGFTFDNERPSHPVQVPEFEIDAQAVCWAQFVEFVEDGGYDRPEFWQPRGWAWLEEKSRSEGRRAPRHVEQIGVTRAGQAGAVLQNHFGQPLRRLSHQPAMHLSWWEADAWCRWAGRRLPTEVEWEVAAHMTTRRGFRWGDVWEWTSSTFAGYPGFTPDPWREYSEPCFGSHKVLRGASFATRARMRSPKFRHFELPWRDDIFCGFRSCAL